MLLRLQHDEAQPSPLHVDGAAEIRRLLRTESVQPSPGNDPTRNWIDLLLSLHDTRSLEDDFNRRRHLLVLQWNCARRVFQIERLDLLSRRPERLRKSLRSLRTQLGGPGHPPEPDHGISSPAANPHRR